MTAPSRCLWHSQICCRHRFVFRRNALLFFFSTSEMRYEYSDAHIFPGRYARVCMHISVFEKDHTDALGHIHKILKLTLKHIKTYELKRKQTQSLKTLQNTFCVVLLKNMLCIQMKLGAGFQVSGLIKASYISVLTAKWEKPLGSSHRMTVFSSPAL